MTGEGEGLASHVTAPHNDTLFHCSMGRSNHGNQVDSPMAAIADM